MILACDFFKEEVVVIQIAKTRNEEKSLEKKTGKTGGIQLTTILTLTVRLDSGLACYLCAVTMRGIGRKNFYVCRPTYTDR